MICASTQGGIFVLHGSAKKYNFWCYLAGTLEQEILRSSIPSHSVEGIRLHLFLSRTLSSWLPPCTERQFTRQKEVCQALKITPRWINFSTHFKVFPRCDTWMNFLKQTQEKFLSVSKLNIFAFDFAENEPYGNFSSDSNISANFVHSIKAKFLFLRKSSNLLK